MPAGEVGVLVGQSGNCDGGAASFRPGSLSNACSSGHFWSLHDGGANFAFADGSTRFLRFDAATVLPQLATRSGGETVRADID
jgi:prepilin-type processing-associated H-X9-DG protein